MLSPFDLKRSNDVFTVAQKVTEPGFKSGWIQNVSSSIPPSRSAHARVMPVGPDHQICPYALLRKLPVIVLLAFALLVRDPQFLQNKVQLPSF